MTLFLGLPVKPYIKQYVLYKQNLLPGDCHIDLSGPGEIPLILRSLLVGKMKGTPYRHEPSEDVYDSILMLKIPQWQMSRSEIVITQEGMHLANQFLITNFQEYLLTRILEGRKAKKTENKIIYEIINEMGIDDLISFDALKKASYRLRKRKKISDFR
jgi:hypothetical protein